MTIIVKEKETTLKDVLPNISTIVETIMRSEYKSTDILQNALMEINDVE